MILIIGGAYQGKLDYAKSALGVTPEQVFACTGREIDFSKRCIYRLEEYSLACVRDGVEPAEEMKTFREQWKDSVLICQDIDMCRRCAEQLQETGEQVSFSGWTTQADPCDGK